MADATAERGRQGGKQEDRSRHLLRVVGYAAHLLPAQGPISIFVHHNTLHAYEYLPFEAAVVEAADLFDCAPFLSEADYRREFARGRILPNDLEAVLAEDLGERAGQLVAGLVTRKQFKLALLQHEVRGLRGAAFEWMLAEGGLADVDLAASGRAGGGSLWDACTAAAARHAEPPLGRRRAPSRHRDLLLEITSADTDALVHPPLIRLCGAFLDQGIAYWPMPDRERGMYHAFRRLYGRRNSTFDAWMRPLTRELEAQEREGRSAVDVVLESLDLLGVPEREWEVFLAATLLALRGWAGIIHQIESRPDRVPVHAPPARLLDFLAVRLLLDRFAVSYLAGERLDWNGPLRDLRGALETRLPQPAGRTVAERAWPLFAMARLHGWLPEQIGDLATAQIGTLLFEFDRFDESYRRRLLHLAYERRHRIEVLDALRAHAVAGPPGPAPPPRFQTLHCIDEREESMRRHIEEAEPRCETFAAAGFFGVAMYYRGIGDAHPMPLCPIAIRPRHEVEETVAEELRGDDVRRRARRRLLGVLTYEAQLASRTFTRGALLSFVLGLSAALPLTFRVLFPRWTARLRRETGRLMQSPARSRLLLERSERAATLGAHAGFTIEEMATIVGGVLGDSGLARRFARLVAVIGHGSSSLNNPHESAHDCGACGGGRGGPNARAFSQMANDPRVRALLSTRGVVIPETTHFVGVYHNTCDDSVKIYDPEAIPPSHSADIAHLQTVLEEARARSAHERCRRFDSASLRLSPPQALAHVEARSEDLAQPRPEYGHATNAVCIIGRRARTRGLFLDRRAFLVSYDPGTDDAAGTVLARVLAAVVPVVAGINLEYYFSRVDPAGYGCATKLPHNIAALLGVMDGHASDLRTGLPWQMVEIHEPVRLLVVVDAAVDTLRRIVAANHDLARLVQNRWIQMAAWPPDGADLWRFTRRGFVRHEPESTDLPRAARSVDWYGGRRGFLRCARIAASGEHA
jgi:uncharacterized protein YbcC (UPF0753/DUF2309 family)